MADTRCVKPKYQLDVDVMILEHLLYHAIDAQFIPLRPLFEKQLVDQYNEDTLATKMRDAERLLHAFNSFIQIFKYSHGEYSFSAGTSFSITILETIVLLRARQNLAQSSSSPNTSSSSTPSIPDSMRRQWLEEQAGFLRNRKAWQEHRDRPMKTVRAGSSIAREEMTMSPWAAFQESHVNSSQFERIVPMFGILHRFMALSSAIAPLMGDINKKWMDLALQLMFQSALEALSQPQQSYQRQLANKESAKNGQISSMPSLMDCFAFGYIPTRAQTATISEAESSINAMLGSSSSSKDLSTVENPDWTSMRAERIAEFQVQPASDGLESVHSPHAGAWSIEPQIYEARVARLKHKYPFSEVEANLLRCIEHFWILCCSEEVNGKPVLVQMEEGGLKGLTDEEFEEFLVRVGLQRDKNGILTFRFFDSKDEKAEDDEGKV